MDPKSIDAGVTVIVTGAVADPLRVADTVPPGEPVTVSVAVCEPVVEGR